jgi:hypothetical protein
LHTRLLRCQIDSNFQQIQYAPGITVRCRSQSLRSGWSKGYGPVAKAAQGIMQRLLDDAQQVGILQRAQQVDTGAGEQGIVQFKGRILGGSTHEDQRPIFHMGQKRILLALVEAVHFIDKQHSAKAIDALASLGTLDSGTNVLDACQHCRKALEVSATGLRQHAGQGCLADAWGGPTESWSAAVRAGSPPPAACRRPADAPGL